MGDESVKAWLQLLRVPNLLTVWGDPLAGFVLATAMGHSAGRMELRLGLAIAVSLLLYMAGLVWNDYFDLAEDRRDRPARPLPSGAIRPATAAIAGTLMLLVALFIAKVVGDPMLHLSVALGAVALAYDGFLKRLWLVGPLAMGLCRGLSLTLGAACLNAQAVWSPAVLTAAGGLTLYVAAVTHIAARETRPGNFAICRWLPALAIVGWGVGLAYVLRLSDVPRAWVFGGLFGLAALLAVAGGVRLREGVAPAAVSGTIGGWIRTLLVLQAAMVILRPEMFAPAVALLVLLPVSAWLGRWFYQS